MWKEEAEVRSGFQHYPCKCSRSRDQNPRRSPGCCELEGALLWEQGVDVPLGP